MAGNEWKDKFGFLLGAALVIVGVKVLSLPKPITPSMTLFYIGITSPFIMFFVGVYLLVLSYDHWGEWYFWPTALVGLLGCVGPLTGTSTGFLFYQLSTLEHYTIFIMEGIVLMMYSFLPLGDN